jgi:antitoxin component YwqK of YwqJK toxin-antitoxin module
MKKVFFLFYISLALFSCKKDDKTGNEIIDTKEVSAEWRDFGLNGNVKSTSEYTTEENRTDENSTAVRAFENQSKLDVALKFEKNGKLSQKTTYNENGNVAEETVYDGKNIILSQKKFTNTKDFVETKYTWKDGNNTIISRRFNGLKLLDKEVFQYISGRKIEKYKYDNHENQSDRTSYTYDDRKRIKEEHYFQGKPMMQNKLVFEYDDNDNKLSEIYYDKDNNLIWKTLSQYNDNKQLVNSQTFTRNNSLDAEIFKTYDEKNRLITTESFETFDNSKNSEAFEYDENDNIISWKIFQNKKLVSTTYYQYDTNNNLTAEVVSTPDGKEKSRKTIEYTYDGNNNWITKRTTINNDRVLLTSRKIEYY